MRINCSTLAYTSENRYKINETTVFVRTKPLTQRWVRGFMIAKSAIVEVEGKPLRHSLGAAIFHGNRLLATGSNGVKSKPENVVNKLDGSEYYVSCHAEQVCCDGIKHYGYDESNTKLIMYVVRVSHNNKFVTSKPCNMCIDYMRKYGIKLVRFINEHGLPEEMSIN